MWLPWQDNTRWKRNTRFRQSANFYAESPEGNTRDAKNKKSNVKARGALELACNLQERVEGGEERQEAHAKSRRPNREICFLNCLIAILATGAARRGILCG